MLSDVGIRSHLGSQIRIDPMPVDEHGAPDIQPASVDLRLGSTFLTFKKRKGAIVPALDQDLTDEHEVEAPDSFYLEPHQFVLGATLERVTLSAWFAARIEGKSSLGRLGLLVHVTAGFVDPGWDGWLTLELYNLAPRPILLTPGMKIAQLAFYELTSPAARPYGHDMLASKYVDPSPKPQASRYHRN